MTDGFDEPDMRPDADSPSPRDFIPLARPIDTSAMEATEPSTAIPPATSDSLLLHGMRRGEAVRDLLTMVVLLLGTELVVGFVAQLAWAAAGGDDAPNEGDFERALIFPMLFLRAAMVVVIVWLVLRNRSQSWPAVGVTAQRIWQNLAFGVAAVMVAAILSFTWQLMLMAFWPKLLQQMIENAEIIMAMIPKQHPLVLGLLAMVVALYEELLFRGFLLPRLRRATNSWVLAVLLSTAVFTLLHSIDQMPAAMVPITILSLVFCVITIWRRSIIPAIFGHFLFDFAQFLYLYLAAGDSWA